MYFEKGSEEGLQDYFLSYVQDQVKVVETSGTLILNTVGRQILFFCSVVSKTVGCQRPMNPPSDDFWEVTCPHEWRQFLS